MNLHDALRYEDARLTLVIRFCFGLTMICVVTTPPVQKEIQVTKGDLGTLIPAISVTISVDASHCYDKLSQNRPVLTLRMKYPLKAVTRYGDETCRSVYRHFVLIFNSWRFV
jgi:hypothetical protein